MVELLCVLGIIVLIIVAVCIGVTISNCLEHVDDYNKCEMELADRRIHEHQMGVVFEQLRAEVAKALKHEQDVLQSIAPENAGIVLVQYPELRGIGVILHLIKDINKYQTWVYSHDLTYNRYVQRINTRQSSPWLYLGLKHYDVNYREL